MMGIHRLQNMGKFIGTVMLVFTMAESAFSESTSATTEAFQIGGRWLGHLATPGGKLRLVLRVTETTEGLTAVLDSPDQGARNLKVDKIDFDGQKLKFKAHRLGLSYSGRLNDDQDIAGKFKQQGRSMRLTFKRVPIVEVARPQTPMPPYDYQLEELSLGFKNGQVLSGTLTIPDAPTAFAVLISGSGQQDRDSKIAEHKLFLVLADFLANHQIGSFRYDDRGVGLSTGDLSEVTTEDFANDLLPVVGYVKKRFELPVGLIGHSEGGSIGTLVSLESDVQFMVMLAGPAVNGATLLDLQNRALMAAMSRSSDSIEARMTILNGLNARVAADDLTGAKKFLKTQYKRYSKDQLLELGLPARSKDLLAPATAPWMIRFLKYEPSEHLSRLKIPVLALYGDKDLQVPSDANASALKTVLAHASSSVVIVESKNHLFQSAETGLPDEYFRIEETMSTDVMERIVTWIQNLP